MGNANAKSMKIIFGEKRVCIEVFMFFGLKTRKKRKMAKKSKKVLVN